MKVIASALLVLIFLACSKDGSGRVTSEPLPQPQKLPVDCVTMNFHYLIREDVQENEKIHKIGVFMDETAFSEDNLRKLFRYVSDKTPAHDDAENLMMFVKTDWRQLGFPSDCPPGGMSGGNGGRDAFNYYWARFYRRGAKESFTFDPVKKQPEKFVVMKGTEVYLNGVWQTPP